MGAYNIPVFLIKETPPEPIQPKLEFIPTTFEETIVRTQNHYFVIVLKNIHTELLTNISLTDDLNLSLSSTQITTLDPNQTAIINISILSNTVQDQLSGKIIHRAAHRITLGADLYEKMMKNYTDSMKRKRPTEFSINT